MLTAKEVARLMDISAVQSQSTLADIDECCAMAREFGAAAVFCLPAHVAYMKSHLGDAPGVKIASVSGVPGGADPTSEQSTGTGAPVTMPADPGEPVLPSGGEAVTNLGG